MIFLPISIIDPFVEPYNPCAACWSDYDDGFNILGSEFSFEGETYFFDHCCCFPGLKPENYAAVVKKYFEEPL